MGNKQDSGKEGKQDSKKDDKNSATSSEVHPGMNAVETAQVNVRKEVDKIMNNAKALFPHAKQKQTQGDHHQQDTADLGESAEVGVGTGDAMLERSIIEGRALDDFHHSAKEALDFAYKHDTVEQQKA